MLVEADILNTRITYRNNITYMGYYSFLTILRDCDVLDENILRDILLYNSMLMVYVDINLVYVHILPQDVIIIKNICMMSRFL
jgi:hypothetical protein